MARIGARRILQRRLMIAGAPGLEMQPAQAKAMRLVMLQHRIVGRDRARGVAQELRGLRLQELGHRLVPMRRLASAECLAADRASPAPTAIMPRDRAWNPFSRLRDRAPTETSDGTRKTKRSTPHTIASAIASATTAPSANRSETSYSWPRQVTSTTPGLFANHVSPRATSASAARKISKRTMGTPLQNATPRKPLGPRAAPISRLWTARELPDRRLADRLQRRVGRLPRAGQRRPVAGRLTRGLGELVERGERAPDIAAPAHRLDLGRQRGRIVACGLVQIAHLHKTVKMNEKAIDNAASVLPRRRGQYTRRNRAERGGERGVGGRSGGHGLQRRQRGGVDAEMLQGRDVGTQGLAVAKPLFAASAMIAIAAAVSAGDRGSVFGAASAVSILPTRAPSAARSALAALVFWAPVFQLRDPRGEV